LLPTKQKAHAMNKAAPPTRWFAPWRRAAPVQQDDPADLGTAFGLEMSLSEAAAKDAAPQAPAAATKNLIRKPSLMRRLTGRRPTVV
jgi:hypothetical protein